MAAESYADMLERLFADYEHKHRLLVIEEVAATSREDLAGQTSPGAELEMLERLVRQRLDELPASGPHEGTSTRVAGLAGEPAQR